MPSSAASEPHRQAGPIGSHIGSRGLVVALVAGALAVVGVGRGSAQVGVDVSAGLGTVETIAGPGFCSGPAALDTGSVAVGAVAVNADGIVHVDAGNPAEGRVTRITTTGRPSVLRTRPRSSPLSELTPTGLPAGAPAAGRLAADPAGGVFVATGRGVLRVAPDAGEPITGEPSVEDAAPGPAGSGDGGPGRQARFRRIASLASDAGGNLFVADLREPGSAEVRIRFLNRSASAVTFAAGTPSAVTVAPGSIETVAGGTPEVDGQEGALAMAASVTGVGVSMAVAGDRLYLAQSSGPGAPRPSSVRVVNLGPGTASVHGVEVGPGTVRTVAGGGSVGLRGDGGPAVDAALSTIGGITVDAAGSLYVADEGNHRVRRIDAAGTITTFAGSSGVGAGGGGFNGNDRAATTARLDAPVDVDAGPDGRIYVSDRGNHQLRYVDASGVIRSTAGNGVQAAWTCEPGASAAPPERPLPGALEGLAADVDGSVYFTVAAFDQVKRLEPSGRVTTVAGTGRRPPSCPKDGCPDAPDGGKASLATLREPAALALRPGIVGSPDIGGLYVVEREVPRVRFLNLGKRSVRVNGVTVVAGTIRTVAGGGDANDAGDGAAAVGLKLGRAPGALAADDAGNLYLADGRRIRKVDQEGRISTVVGLGRAVPSAPERPPGALPPCCGTITGLAVAPGGALYAADAQANVIWAANPGTTPIEVRGRTLPPGGSEPIAGTGQSGFEGDGGPATDAQIVPYGIAVDPAGAVFAGQVVGAPRPLVDAQGKAILDDKGRPRIMGDPLVSIDHSVRKVGSDGVISTVIGAGTSGFNGDGLPGRSTTVAVPTTLALDRCGNLLLVDRDNDRIRRLRLAESCPEPVTTSDGSDFVLSPPLLAVLSALGLAAVLRASRRRRRH